MCSSFPGLLIGRTAVHSGKDPAFVAYDQFLSTGILQPLSRGEIRCGSFASILPCPFSRPLSPTADTVRHLTRSPHRRAIGLLRARRERPRRRRAAERGQQFPPCDGDSHTPLPCEVRKGTIPRHERAVPNSAAPAEGGAHVGHRPQRSAAWPEDSGLICFRPRRFT